MDERQKTESFVKTSASATARAASSAAAAASASGTGLRLLLRLYLPATRSARGSIGFCGDAAVGFVAGAGLRVCLILSCTWWTAHWNTGFGATAGEAFDTIFLSVGSGDCAASLSSLSFNKLEEPPSPDAIVMASGRVGAWLEILRALLAVRAAVHDRPPSLAALSANR